MSAINYSLSNDLDKNPQLKKHKFNARFSKGRVIHEWNDERCDVWIDRKRVGAGAGGFILLQENEATKELRAVKKLWKEGLTGMGRIVERELTHLISVMDRPDLFVQFSGWYESGDSLFYVMEYHEHGDLSQYIKHDRGKACREAREISKQLLEGLEELHKRQICHRDLKPQNILVASLSPIHVKLADFGISKRQTTSQMNTLGVGTPGYIAPELLSLLPQGPPADGCQPYSNAIDMWSLGCVVYLLLTGNQPFMRDGHFNIATFIEFCGGKMETMLNCIKDPDALDFVQKLLVCNAGDRMSASQALNHTWIMNAQFTNSTSINQCSTSRPTTPKAYVATAPKDLSAANTLPSGTPPARPSPALCFRQLCFWCTLSFLTFYYFFAYLQRLKVVSHPVLYSF